MSSGYNINYAVSSERFTMHFMRNFLLLLSGVHYCRANIKEEKEGVDMTRSNRWEESYRRLLLQ